MGFLSCSTLAKGAETSESCVAIKEHSVHVLRRRSTAANISHSAIESSLQSKWTYSVIVA